MTNRLKDQNRRVLFRIRSKGPKRFTSKEFSEEFSEEFPEFEESVNVFCN